MPAHVDVRHFKNGISMVSQWTGGEYKEMEKVFGGLMAGHADPAVIETATAVVDFIYLASPPHPSPLSTLRSTPFTRTSKFFWTLKREAKHYTPMIRLFGSADGFNTEAPERLHIDYAKAGYRASNKKDYIPQMTLWLQRQEAAEAPFDDTSPAVPATPVKTAEITRVVPPPKPLTPAALPATATPAALPAAVTYKIAKAHPTELRNITISSIMAAATYLRKQSAPVHFMPQPFDRFDLFKRITITLPSIRQVSDAKLRNVVRASPPIVAV
ncbi:hypothetical protein B0H10DRAFT_2223102 [Mycena sp. CBHHK59/15]|nr:hypothetical protein B0H10DRAFT_2223102 [Mycena sp. CBHHK59/15]